jgi:catechol 2,3-dioxygenase-like lactoylglutathione lyase family enzyme
MIRGLDFVSLPSQDLSRSVAFYRDQLGLPPITVEDKWAEFDLGGGAVLGVVHPASFGVEFAAVKTGMVALRVDDVAKAIDELKAKGVEIPPAMDTGVCHMAFFADPDGNSLCLHNRYAPED